VKTLALNRRLSELGPETEAAANAWADAAAALERADPSKQA
jgi:hypothetical protein